jgi:hypothetical protein
MLYFKTYDNGRILTFLTFMFLLGLINSCNNIDKKNLIANYERDKMVPADTLKSTINKIDNSGGWTICLKDENIFQFKGTDTVINGMWTVERKDGEDYFLKFQFDKDFVEGRLNGNIIYFDKQKKMFDNLFDYVLFVKTTRKID